MNSNNSSNNSSGGSDSSTNNTNSNTKQKTMTKEEKRKMLKAKLRAKIKGKAGNRLGKNNKNSQYNQAQEALKTMVSSAQQEGNGNVDINNILKNFIPDAKARKVNKKRIEKMINESKAKVNDIM
jgi:hypothetical protein